MINLLGIGPNIRWYGADFVFMQFRYRAGLGGAFGAATLLGIGGGATLIGDALKKKRKSFYVCCQEIIDGNDVKIDNIWTFFGCVPYSKRGVEEHLVRDAPFWATVRR